MSSLLSQLHDLNVNIAVSQAFQNKRMLKCSRETNITRTQRTSRKTTGGKAPPLIDKQLATNDLTR
jgi:hypothetical protein